MTTWKKAVEENFLVGLFNNELAKESLLEYGSDSQSASAVKFTTLRFTVLLTFQLHSHSIFYFPS